MQALVVDDSKSTRAILKRLLVDYGIREVVEAGNGQEALEILEDLEKPGLVLLDLNMPVMSGMEFVRCVRANRAYDGMFIIAVSTEGNLSRIVTALNEGVDEYLMKPFTPEAMSEKLQLLGIRPGE